MMVTHLKTPSEYRSIVGALHYLSLTRPDIAFLVNQVCQFMHNPTTIHWAAVKRILQYIIWIADYGLFVQLGTFRVKAYSYADWAGGPDDQRYQQVGYVSI